MQKAIVYDCFCTVGGGICENETSENATLRECYEDRGHHFEIERLVVVQKRFHRLDVISHQEPAFFYLMKEQNSEIHGATNTDQNNEHLHWIPISNLKNINLVPSFLRTEPETIPSDIKHILSYEQDTV